MIIEEASTKEKGRDLHQRREVSSSNIVHEKKETKERLMINGNKNICFSNVKMISEGNQKRTHLVLPTILFAGDPISRKHLCSSRVIIIQAHLSFDFNNTTIFQCLRRDTLFLSISL